MKKYFILCLCVFLYSFNICMAENFEDENNINIVKNSILKLDESITIGDALETYEYFSDVSWECFKTKQRRTVVEFKGRINLLKVMEYILNNTNLYDRDDGFNPNGKIFWTRYKKRAEMCVENNNCILNNFEWYMIIQFFINKNNTLKLGYIGFIGDYGKNSGNFNDIESIYKGNCLGNAIYIAGKVISENKDVISCDERYFPSASTTAYFKEIKNVSNKNIATFISYDENNELDFDDTFDCYIDADSISLDDLQKYIGKKVHISFMRYQHEDVINKQCIEDWILDYVSEEDW